MPATRYAPLPNPITDPDAQNEMEAAFLDSDDEEDEGRVARPPRGRNGYQSLPNAEPSVESPSSPSSTTVPFHAHKRSTNVPTDGTYDFENVDYDADWTLRPPPGSPPPAADALQAFRESQGNTNGRVPDFSDAAREFARRFGEQRREAGGWLSRVVPESLATRLGIRREEGGSMPAVGGGMMNDGVFANVTAKPSRAIRIQEGDSVYLVPEESQKDAPPSYASAQADAVPPYWETTIHAPSASTAPGDMVVDALPTGSLFSFLWNMLVSISFQFVGFLLTYLLHTTHAAKLGSRAGLGVTLIQYGFAMRSRAEEWAREGAGSGGEVVEGWGWQVPSEPAPTFGTAAEADAYYGKMNSTALPSSTPIVTMEQGSILGDATTEWLSFFLMTVGWFILLTSLLSFWRVKRWERGILASAPSPSLPLPTSSSAAPPSHLFSRLNLLRAGLGFSVSNYPGASTSPRSADDDARSNSRSIFDGDIFNVAEGDDGELEDVSRGPRGNYVIPIDESNPERTHTLARAYADEARLQRDLRAAGLL